MRSTSVSQRRLPYMSAELSLLHTFKCQLVVVFAQTKDMINSRARRNADSSDANKRAFHRRKVIIKLLRIYITLISF